MKLTKDQEKEIIRLKKIKTKNKIICEMFNITSKTIYDVIKRNGRDKYKPNKKYSVNENYFEKIDNEEKAYWLGFLYADGYVRIKNGRSGELKLKLKKADRNHIELFKKHINSNHTIKDIKNFIIVDNKMYESKSSTFSIYNTKIVKDLIKLGCVNNKTQKIKLPNLKSELMRHFIRGYFDGDGSISVTENNKIMTIIGNYTFIRQLKEYLNLSRLTISDFKNYSILKLSYNNELVELKELLYLNSNVFLSRKKEIFNKIKKIDFAKHYDNIAYNSSKNTFLQFDLNNNFIKKWYSMRDILKGKKWYKSRIYECCNNKVSSAYGFVWKYEV